MKNALLLHNPHWQNKKYNIAIQRNTLEKLISYRNTKEIFVIKGIRRSGKSSLLKLYINRLMKDVDPLSILFINFDDPVFSTVYAHPEKIHDIIIQAEQITETNVKYLFLDEIQSVLAWEKYIKSVYDSNRFEKIIITGSNSKLLSGDYSGLLSGRYLSFQLYPLSLQEILRYYGISNKLSLENNKSKVLNIINNLLRYGSFPEVFLQSLPEIKRDLLTHYYDSILIKDCVINQKIRDVVSFKQLAFYLLNNSGNLFSYNSLAKALDMTDLSVKDYILAMKEAFLLYELPQFSFKTKQVLKSKRKIYTIDNGFINAVAPGYIRNTGQRFENWVFDELTKKGLVPKGYYLDKRECDFIIKNHDFNIAIQVSYELTPENIAREVKSLLEVKQKFGITDLYILTFNQHNDIHPEIKVLPVYDLFGV